MTAGPYLALLRGINVGGKNKVEMARLRAAFEKVGMDSVRTYINSGNVIFATGSNTAGGLAPILQDAIEDEFGLSIKVLVRDIGGVRTVVEAIPNSWANNSEMRCDVLFLWEEYDTPDVLAPLVINPDIEDVFYVPGAVIWRVDRVNRNKSNLTRIVGTEFYRHVTIRNCNTVRKLALLMGEIEA